MGVLLKADYTVDKYEKLCVAIGSSQYTVTTLADYLKIGKSNVHHIILRHDIDRSPQRALEIAKVEHRHGMKATYYFRTSTYKINVIDEIQNLGHEIGFHYETLDKSKGNIKKAVELFQDELSLFRQRYIIETVCAHGNPLTRNDNKTIWRHISKDDYKLLGEAFLDLDFQQFAYFSDSGRTWENDESQKMPGKDSVKTAFDDIKAKNTDDLISIIQRQKLPNICILSHPERWCGNMISYTGRLILDYTFSTGKTLISLFRKIKN